MKNKTGIVALVVGLLIGGGVMISHEINAQKVDAEAQVKGDIKTSGDTDDIQDAGDVVERAAVADRDDSGDVNDDEDDAKGDRSDQDEQDDDDEEEAIVGQASVTEAEAVKIAKTKYTGGGRLTDTELEMEKGVLVYAVEFTESDGNEVDIKIDAKTGIVVVIEDDRTDEDGEEDDD